MALARGGVLLGVLLATLAASGCAWRRADDAVLALSEPCVDTAPPPPTFYTDNCTWFPDRPSWLPCCIEHDRAYWHGGSLLERLRADGRLAACVAARSEPVVAGFMFVGVRIIGMPWVPTLSRWGYGRAAGHSRSPCAGRRDARP